MVSRKKSAIFILCIGMLLIVAVVIVSRPNHPFAGFDIASPEDAAAFLSNYGWECDSSEITTQTTMLPNQFDTILSNYNTLQMEQGCDLTDYAGKEIIIYTAPIKNYGDMTQNIYATILVYNNKIIGGDIHSAELNGFMHSFI